MGLLCVSVYTALTAPSLDRIWKFIQRGQIPFTAQLLPLFPPNIRSLKKSLSSGKLISLPGGRPDTATRNLPSANTGRPAEAKTARDRIEDNGAKTGFFTGLYAKNPVTGTLLPVFSADYVLMDYGTGAIMAVPGGDQRDYEFADAFGLPVIYTVKPSDGSQDSLGNYEGKSAYTLHDGIVINSPRDADEYTGTAPSLNGMSVDKAAEAMVAWLEREGAGEGRVSYRLRDWLFSRQRYWGEPFPRL